MAKKDTVRNTDMLRVKDMMTKEEGEMSNFAYDQVRLEQFDGRPRYKVLEGSPNPLPAKNA